MAVQRLTDYTRRIWVGLSTDEPDPDMQAGDVIYYMDTSTCSIITGIPAPGSIDTEDLPDVGGGGGGDYTAADFVDETKPTGVFEFLVTSTNLNSNYFTARTGVTKLLGWNYNDTGNHNSLFRDMTNLQCAVLPKQTKLYNYAFYGCSKLEALDWLGGQIAGSNAQFGNCVKLNVIVIRKSDGVCSLANTNAFTNTPFASGHSGGTLYVPQAVIESYQNATNWSTILAYTNNQILPIEGSIYETQYADGTRIQ